MAVKLDSDVKKDAGNVTSEEDNGKDYRRNSKFRRGKDDFNRHRGSYRNARNRTSHSTNFVPSKKLGSVEKDTVMAKHNDPSWYAYNPDLLRDAFSIPFTYPLGLDLKYQNDLYTEHQTSIMSDRIPGIAIMELLTGPGRAIDVNSAVNISARDLYAFVRHANSGHSNYDPADLMMYILAVDEAYMWYYNAVRAYGTITMYNPQNRYAPQGLVNALGWDFNDLTSNLAQFRYKINSYAARLNALNVPANFPLLKRHGWLYSGIYLDGTSPKSQMYAYIPAGYKVYDETVATGSQLTFKTLRSADGETRPLLTYANFVTICDELANALTGSEDIGIISGDILKAFSSSNLIKLPTIDEKYAILPTFDTEVVSQFMNATCQVYKLGGTQTTFNVTQDPTLNHGTINFDPQFSYSTTSAEAYLDNKFNPRFENPRLNLMVDNPTPEQVSVATRLMVCPGKLASDASNTWHLRAFGSEIPCMLTIYTLKVMDNDGLLLTDTFIDPYYTISVNGNQPNMPYAKALSLMQAMDRISQFDYHPLVHATFDVHLGDPTTTATSKVYTSRLQDVQTYAVVAPSILDNMHETAILSEYSVPLKYSTL